MNKQRLAWYAQRLGRMSPSEVGWRIVDGARHQNWRRLQVRPGASFTVAHAPAPHFRATLPGSAARLIPEEAARYLVASAEGILNGEWQVLGIARKDVEAPDWFFDPITGLHAPQEDYCFSIDHRSESVTGNVKQVWELSRLQHVTLLAAAYSASGSEVYAEAAARQLSSWWEENPFLSGVHWTSGIEIGIRLISWVWARRLLEGWPGAPALFEENERALAQIWWHQRYLAAFRSRGSSANNHVIAEAAGQLVASLAFPWFAESPGWAEDSAALLQRELAANTFPGGVNREMAFEYHGFVAELGIIAAVEADRAGRPLDESTGNVLCRMLDVVAATVDETLHPPRYGDADEGRGFLLGSPEANRWATLLAIGKELYGAPAWWPHCHHDAASSLVAALATNRDVTTRPAARPATFPDAGLTILRTRPGEDPEIWCRCDGGPHGFLSIAGHAHADALSVEVRHGGVDILADPGTYCYHGEKLWRSYFRSTLAHNTVEIGGVDQSTSGGPFLWTRQARTMVTGVSGSTGADTMSWTAQHDGYTVLDPPALHRRTVRLLGTARRLEISDEIETAGTHPYRIAYHLGPDVSAELDGDRVLMSWTTPAGTTGSGTLRLPEGPAWSLVRGGSDPVLGWYSPGFGEKTPATTVVGQGSLNNVDRLLTILQFDS